MSLQLIAKQMEAKGRNGDSVLVHMTTGEVAGLQKLAESAGGSLTVNPETGLVEANFLKSMLPTLVGAGVGFMTGNPYLGAAAGSAVGGYQAKRAGRDVGAGMVMGGLGGYGGATFGSSLQAAAPAAGAPAANAGTGAASKTATNMANQAVMGQVMAGAQPQAFTPAQLAAAQAEGAILSPLDRMATPLPVTNAGAPAPVAVAPVTTPPPPPAAPPQKSFADMSFSERVSQGRRGLEALNTQEGRDAAYKSMGGSEGMMRALMFAGLPYLSQAPTSRRSPHPLLSADINKKGFADGGSIDSIVANRQYMIDPATGDVILNPNYRRATTFANMTGSGDAPVDPNPEWTKATPEAKAAYYAANPMMGAITRAGQSALSYMPIAGPMLALQNRMDPGFQQEQEALTRGSVIDIGGPISRTELRGTELGDLAPGGDGGLGNQNFGGGFNYGGDYDSYSSDRNSDGSTGPGDSSGRSSGGGDGVDGKAEGGLLALARGGLASGGFVVPADVVSMVGEGNTDAGYKRIKASIPSAVAIKGKDGGQADTVKTRIDGKQPARVAHGEMYIPPETVKRMGGAKKLYAMMDRVRMQATGSRKQIRPVSLKKAMA